jgi:uncharacterized membrane protein
MTTSHRIKVKESLELGWKTFKAAPWLFITIPLVLLAIATGISIVEEILSVIFGEQQMELIVHIESFATTMLMSIGIGTLYLKALHKIDSAELRDLWNPKPFWRYVGVSVFGGTAILLGLVLLIVPGIIIALAFSLSGLLVIEKGFGPIEALKESVRLTKGHRLDLLKLNLANLGINILGVCAFVVGLFVTVPVTELAFVNAYRKLTKGVASRSAVHTSTEV